MEKAEIFTHLCVIIVSMLFLFELLGSRPAQATCSDAPILGCESFVIVYQNCRASFPACIESRPNSRCCDVESGPCVDGTGWGHYEACFSFSCCDYNPN